MKKQFQISNLKLPGKLMHATTGLREQGGGPDVAAHSLTSVVHEDLAALEDFFQPWKRRKLRGSFSI